MGPRVGSMTLPVMARKTKRIRGGVCPARPGVEWCYWFRWHDVGEGGWRPAYITQLLIGPVALSISFWASDYVTGRGSSADGSCCQPEGPQVWANVVQNPSESTLIAHCTRVCDVRNAFGRKAAIVKGQPAKSCYRTVERQSTRLRPPGSASTGGLEGRGQKRENSRALAGQARVRRPFDTLRHSTA
ncbi:hypothetical protein LX36DRAFT_287248 [Colletotrichum falcatum]|nr:hypothetical protein LX36DRAFT_287248 [Colletotrichum falcatum]